MSQTIQDYLARKDSDFEKFVPKGYKITQEQKREMLFLD